MGQVNLFNPFKNASGALVPAQLGKQADLWVSQRHGKYYTPAYAGSSFFIGNTAGVTLVAASATTYTGLAIQNPAASGVNLVLQKFRAVGTVIAAAMQTVALANGHTTFTVSDSISPLSTTFAAAATASKAKVSASATLDGAATVAFAIGATQIAAGSYSISEDFDGGLLIPPGQYIAVVDPVGTPTASSFMGAFFWEEVPV